MPRACTVCGAPERDSIDAELARATPIRSIARRFDLGVDSLRRHRRAHLTPALVAVVGRREGRRAERLVDRVERIVGDAEAILVGAQESGRVTAALAAIRELRSLFELLGRLTGELDDRPTVSVNLLAAPEWLAVRAAILDALADHPAARQSVAARLAGLGGVPALPHAPDRSDAVAVALASPEVSEGPVAVAAEDQS